MVYAETVKHFNIRGKVLAVFVTLSAHLLQSVSAIESFIVFHCQVYNEYKVHARRIVSQSYFVKQQRLSLSFCAGL